MQHQPFYVSRYKRCRWKALWMWSCPRTSSSGIFMTDTQWWACFHLLGLNACSQIWKTPVFPKYCCFSADLYLLNLANNQWSCLHLLCGAVVMWYRNRKWQIYKANKQIREGEPPSLLARARWCLVITAGVSLGVSLTVTLIKNKDVNSYDFKNGFLSLVVSGRSLRRDWARCGMRW